MRRAAAPRRPQQCRPPREVKRRRDQLADAFHAHEREDERRHEENSGRLDTLAQRLAFLSGEMTTVLIIVAALLGNAIYRMVT